MCHQRVGLEVELDVFVVCDLGKNAVSPEEDGLAEKWLRNSTLTDCCLGALWHRTTVSASHI